MLFVCFFFFFFFFFFFLFVCFFAVVIDVLCMFACTCTFKEIIFEACLGYFGIRDIHPFLFWDIDPIYFGIWDMQEFWDMGYWNLFWDTS